jgi:hypothetical protein
MTGYINIAIIAFILLIISFYNENYNIEYLHNKRFEIGESSKLLDGVPNLYNYFYIYSIRYSHYLIYLYCSFFLLFFYGIGTEMDRYIYLSFIIFIFFTWYIFDICILSFLELLFYNIPIKNMDKKFHPTFYPLFYKYAEKMYAMSGLFLLLTVITLLYNLNTIHISSKILYFILFVGLYLYPSV